MPIGLVRSVPRRTEGGHSRMPSAGLAMLVAGAVPQAALAQSATPGSTGAEIVVTAPRDVIAPRLGATAGGTAVVTAESMPATANLTISRALADVPGVVVQDFFGGNDQPRIQIRGSGLQQNPVERGVLVLQDGLPLNRADGSYVVGFANPGSADAIEIYRGYTANRLGATVLGGALNLMSPTGRSSPGVKLNLSGGSFDQIGGLAEYGLSRDGFDMLLHGDVSHRDGFRVYNKSERTSVGGNLGFRLSDAFTLRAFARYTDLGFDVAGPLTRDLLESNPRSVFAGPTVTPGGPINPGPNVVRDRPRREPSQLLIGARATGSFGSHIVDLAVGYTQTDDSFRFPISAGVRVTDGHDATAVLRYAYKPDGSRPLPLFEATGQYVNGSADRDQYLNLSGRRGAQFGNNRLKADTLALNAAFNIPLGDRITLSPSLAWSRATRDNVDRYALPARPTAAYAPANPTMALPGGAVPTVSSSYARDYEGWSPALGISWRAAEHQTLFAAISRSFEPPTHDDLFATVNGTPNSSAGRPNPANPAMPAAVFVTPDLKAQRATTLEAGWRGDAGVLSWDGVLYYSWVRNELLSLRDASGTSLGAVNAPRTRHFGVELGVTARIAPALTGRIVYTFQDFRFRDDALRGDNRLAGAPRHWVHATLAYRPLEGLALEAALRWVPEKTPVDNLGTLYNDPYAIADLRGTYRISDRLSLFAEITNLFDKTYASSSLIVDHARPDQAVFLPGDGRSFGGGVTVRF
ncbi:MULTISPECIES: TonB-dependent receptor family protein [Sphingomonadaceae]|uniref:TonB-dependent receptor family protein n=1 Tax=Sphingomonadales TaxID=204457 RepID=UPI0018D405AF|nr:TonB-dependent receptor [Sphingobium sp. TKS]MCF8707819.1 TonB-dependent receptor [Rhizorhapis sp. SPR117]